MSGDIKLIFLQDVWAWGNLLLLPGQGQQSLDTLFGLRMGSQNGWMRLVVAGQKDSCQQAAFLSLHFCQGLLPSMRLNCQSSLAKFFHRKIFNSFALLDKGLDVAKGPFISRHDRFHGFVDKVFCSQQAFYFIQ